MIFQDSLFVAVAALHVRAAIACEPIAIHGRTRRDHSGRNRRKSRLMRGLGSGKRASAKFRHQSAAAGRGGWRSPEHWLRTHPSSSPTSRQRGWSVGRANLLN